MKIKLFSLLFAFCFLLCGCNGEQDDINTDELVAAIENINSETRLSGQYMIEMNFGEGVTLYYALGDVAWDTEKEIASAIFDQTYLGVSSKAENYFKEGKLTSYELGESITIDRDSEELFSKFPYCKVFPIEEKESMTVSESTVGTTYTVVYNNTAEICEKIIGGDIYSLASVIKNPQPDKTQYGKTTCVYTVSQGEIVGCRYEFDVKLFDTPAYVPGGYSVPENEYTLDLHITAKMSYKLFGDNVTVSEYSEKTIDK